MRKGLLLRLIKKIFKVVFYSSYKYIVKKQAWVIIRSANFGKRYFFSYPHTSQSTFRNTKFAFHIATKKPFISFWFPSNEPTYFGGFFFHFNSKLIQFF